MCYAAVAVSSSRIDPFVAASFAAWLALSACACSDPVNEVDARPPGPRDGGEAGVTGDGAIRDAGDAAAGDAGGGCGGATCTGFERCVSGACMPLPACDGAGRCPEGSTCHARRCVPDEIDVDGDGSPAGEDCDETSAERSPDLPEICDGIDDDCDERVDEGDPLELCEFNPGGGTCIMGSCGCPPGQFDLIPKMPGCECTAMPRPTEGLSCMEAIDLGPIADTMQRMVVTGNVMPDDREVWYRFRGVDSPDTDCDAWHVRVLMMTNPADAFEFTVFTGDCGTLGCADQGYTDFERMSDFRMDVMGMMGGQCPCSSASPPPAGVTPCSDESTDYFVRVRRRPGIALSCAAYVIEISNGLY